MPWTRILYTLLQDMLLQIRLVPRHVDADQRLLHAHEFEVYYERAILPILEPLVDDEVRAFVSQDLQ
jgi:hypothetical protein